MSMKCATPISIEEFIKSANNFNKGNEANVFREFLNLTQKAIKDALYLKQLKLSLEKQDFSEEDIGNLLQAAATGINIQIPKPE